MLVNPEQRTFLSYNKKIVNMCEQKFSNLQNKRHLKQNMKKILDKGSFVYYTWYRKMGFTYGEDANVNDAYTM